MAAAWVPVDFDVLEDDDPPGVDPSLVAVLLDHIRDNRPAWMADALCQEYPEVNFFPAKGEGTEPAKAICARCPCDLECARYAVETDARDGIWSGETARNLRRGKGLTPVKE